MGYARVSSKDQNLDRQIEQLKAEKVFTYYTDKASGGSRERPGLDEAMRYVRAGDQLVVTSMDRCARSLTDLYAIVDELVSKGVSVKFLKEGQTYSKDSTPIAKLMLGLLGFVQLGKAVKELDQHREIVEKITPQVSLRGVVVRTVLRRCRRQRQPGRRSPPRLRDGLREQRTPSWNRSAAPCRYAPPAGSASHRPCLFRRWKW